MNDRRAPTKTRGLARRAPRAGGLLLLLLAPLLSADARAVADPPPEEVGIDEKLGARVPLDLVLNDEDGRPVRLGSLLDKPTALTLNYFRCAGICTPLLRGVLEVINRTPAEPGRDYQVVTVSFDERDTPEIASTKRANFLREIERPFPPGAWRFLTGKAETTRALCDAVGFRFKPDGDGFVHAGAILFLSPDGRVTRYLYGTTYLPADFAAAAGEAARGEPTPTVARLLKICFRYDPVGRRYVFSATKGAALVVLAAAAGFLVFLLRSTRRTTTPSGDTA